MNNPARFLTFFFRARRELFGFAALGWLLLTLGCSTPGPASAPVNSTDSGTHLVVVNLTSYVWRLAINTPSGSEPVAVQVQPQASLRINLRGGDYAIEQTALAENAGPELTRRILVRLEAGQTYRWPLVTLLSDSPSGEPR